MATWEESEHPRDDKGKFTFKNGGALSGGSNSNFLNREDILYPTMKDKEPNYDDIYNGRRIYNNENLSREDILKEDNGIFTGAAASIVTDEIAGVKRGKPMALEDAIKDVNPNFTRNGNQTYTTNCQGSVIVADARVRGFNLNVDIEYESEFKNQLSKRPNIAYIDPKTGKAPEFTNIKVSNEVECETFLNNTIKQNERYFFGFTWKYLNNEYIGHIVLVVKDENNKIKFYDPQIIKHITHYY